MKLRQNRNDYPPELKAQIATFLKNHVDDPESTATTVDKHQVAKIFGLDDCQVVYRVAKQCGIKLKKAAPQLEQRQLYVKEFIERNTDLTTNELSARLGESYDNIKHICRKFGIQVRAEKAYTPSVDKMISIFSFEVERLFIGDYIF
jgi:hypothetical protein